MEAASLFLNHVVLADDDLDHAVLFQRVLNQVDPSKQLSIVTDGEQLMELLSLQVPQLLFLDLNMPCKHGFECLQEIRKNARLNDMNVVVYTSSTEMTNIQRSYIHKADLYMVKPFSTSQLQHALESVFKLEWRNQPGLRHYYINNRFVPYTA
jgi:CheY-like chemotaxis protein